MGLVVHHVWTPGPGKVDRPPVAFVSEQVRARVGLVMIASSVVMVSISVLVQAPYWLDFVFLLAAWLGAAYAGTGHGGWYEVNPNGTLGDYLGRSPPDLSDMVRSP